MMIKFAIFLCVFFSGMGTFIILPILGPLIRELHLTESQGGWMISLGSIAMALMATVWGKQSDKFGRKPIILAGFIGLFFSYALYTGVIWYGLNGLLIGSMLLTSLIAARALVGAFLSAVPAGAQAYIADNTSAADRSKGMALIGVANGFGMIFGTAISGVIAQYGLIWPMLFATVLPVIALIVVYFALPPAKPRLHSKAPAINIWDRNLMPWLLIGFLTIFAIVTLQIIAGFYFQDQLGLSSLITAKMMGIALTLVGVAVLLTQIAQMKWLQWGAHRMVMVGLPIMMAGFLCLLLTASIPSYYLAYALFGVGAGLLLPGFMSGESLAVSAEQQGAVAGLSAAVQGLAAIIAPLSSTLLYEYAPQLPFLLLLGLFLLAWIMMAFKPQQALEGSGQATPALEAQS